MADTKHQDIFDDQEKLKLEKEKRLFKIKAGIFLAGVTFASAIAGFSTTVATVRKKEQEILLQAGFDQAKITEMLTQEAGSRLAMRALGWGTLYAFLGVGFICYSGWKLSGASNFIEFREAVGKILPRIPKSANPGRSNFDNLEDFVDYISKKPSDS